MKESRKLLNKAGGRLYKIVIAFSLIQDFVIVPLIGLIWKLTLMTTPDGFISNANIGRTLLRSPWIIIVGLALLGAFLLFSMWQVAATVLGVAYAHEGKSPKTVDLLKISAREIFHETRPKNWMLLLYTVIILPLTDVFHASNVIGSFVVPEYIKDFINARLYLHVMYFALLIAAIYFELRLFYVLPSFFLKERDYKKASAESYAYTKKGMLQNGIRLVAYGFIEAIRLAIVPFVIIVVVTSAAYLSVATKPYAPELFTVIVLKTIGTLFDSICGTLVYLSTMCFVVSDYYARCKDSKAIEEIKLPELTREAKRTVSGRIAQIRVTVTGVAVSVGTFLLALWAAGIDPSIVDILVNKPVVIAHKGYSSLAPENTMDAFRLADATENADYIELDVWSSKDGIPVVIHNETITAATGLKGNVYDYTFEELNEIPAPYAMDINEFPDARIPSLEEVIASYAETTPLLIEIKGYKKDEQLPAKIVALMEKYNCTETSMIHSGNYAALKAVKECNPDIRCGLIQAIASGNSYDLPYADFLCVEHSFVTKSMIKQLHSRGKKLYVWTVNFDDSVKKLKVMDVDGFITDYPDKISEAVNTEIEPFEDVADSIAIEQDAPSNAIREFEEGNY